MKLYSGVHVSQIISIFDGSPLEDGGHEIFIGSLGDSHTTLQYKNTYLCDILFLCVGLSRGFMQLLQCNKPTELRHCVVLKQ